MKTKVLMMVALFAGLAAMASPSFAHHGAAAFDMGTPVVLKGAVITEFLWINPHPLIKADFKDEKGEVQHWTMELGSTVWHSSSAGAERRSSPETSSRCTSGRPRQAQRSDASTRSTSPTARPCVIPSRRRRRRASRHGRAPVSTRAASQPPSNATRAQREGSGGSLLRHLRACVRSFQVYPSSLVVECAQTGADDAKSVHGRNRRRGGRGVAFGAGCRSRAMRHVRRGNIIRRMSGPPSETAGPRRGAI